MRVIPRTISKAAIIKSANPAIKSKKNSVSILRLDKTLSNSCSINSGAVSIRRLMQRLNAVTARNPFRLLSMPSDRREVCASSKIDASSIKILARQARMLDQIRTPNLCSVRILPQISSWNIGQKLDCGTYCCNLPVAANLKFIEDGPANGFNEMTGTSGFRR